MIFYQMIAQPENPIVLCKVFSHSLGIDLDDYT